MDTTFRNDHKAALDKILLGIPGVKGSKSFGYPAYKFGKKVFCFVGSKGISIKLPEARVKELVSAHPEMKVFTPAEGMVWNGWVSIARDNSEDYNRDRALFDESIAFVGES